MSAVNRTQIASRGLTQQTLQKCSKNMTSWHGEYGRKHEIFETLLKARDICVHMHMCHMHIYTYTPHIHGPSVCMLTHIHICTHGHVYIVPISTHTAPMYNVYANAWSSNNLRRFTEAHPREPENCQIKTRLWKEGILERANNRPYGKLLFPF